MFVNTTEIDSGALGRYLQAHVAGLRLPLQVTRFSGGQSNPTFLLTDVSGSRFVLRTKPQGKLLASAHAVDREFRVMQALRGSSVPVAQVYCLCEDPSVIGSDFYVMEYVQGRIFWDPAMPELTAVERGRVHDEMNRVVAALHMVDPAAVGLLDFGRPQSFMQRQVARWSGQYMAAQTETIEAMNCLMKWLPDNLPDEGATRIFHGDLRLDNVIFHPTESRIMAVLDWELSTLGDPLADLAYHMLPWRLTSTQFRGMAEKDLDALGIPGEAQYLSRYLERTGRDVIDPAAWEFYVRFAMFRLAAILQGVRKRALQGNASNAQAMQTGALARTVAECGWAGMARSKVF